MGSFCILLYLIRLIMPTAIQFDNQPCFRAIKIYNIIPNYFLSLKSKRISAKKLIP